MALYNEKIAQKNGDNNWFITILYEQSLILRVKTSTNLN